jgi:septation ring formation regulator EzrA
VLNEIKKIMQDMKEEFGKDTEILKNLNLNSGNENLSQIKVWWKVFLVWIN